MITKSGHKIAIFLFCIVIAFLVLVARLYYLQIVQGDNYLQRSESNFIQERVVKHSRGKILDSEGGALADNRLAYDVYVTFAMLPDSLKNLRALTQPLTLTRHELLELDRELVTWAKNRVGGQIEVGANISAKQCTKVSEIARVAMMAGVVIDDTVSGKKRTCQISIKSDEFPSQAQTLNLLTTLLGDRQTTLEEDWQRAEKKSQGLGRFKPNLLVPDVGFDVYARIENAISLGRLAGITVVPSKRRRYVQGDFATHTIGFVNQVSIADIQSRTKAYRSGDFIGRNGLEASFEDILRGVDGAERVVVDAKGRRFDEAWEEALLGSERISDPTSGQSIKLSLDPDLQKAAQDLFLGISGSVVVSEVDTGFILAMASFPSFDPNGLVSADNAKLFKKLLADKERPLRNKAVQDHYSPGSIFKPITSIAGLAKKLITPSFQYYCTGSYQIHRTQWRCFKREGHGYISLREALKVSCDGYFYDLGHRLGLDALSEIGKQLGFGQKTGIDLLGETSGLVPSKEYYKKRFGYVAPGFVVNMAIGQGDLGVSPIQVAMAYGALANGGIVYKPQLVREILNDQGEVVKKFDPLVNSSVADSSYDFEEIIEGMSYVAEPGGSAYSLRYKPENADINRWINEGKVMVVGKTGTAQVVKLSKLVKHVEVEDVPYEHRDHAWFVGLYPREDPKIVVVVMAEHAGFGGAMSAPVAVRLMKRWQEKNASRPKENVDKAEGDNV